MNQETVFRYYATDDSGRAHSGTVHASDRGAALEELKRGGLQVLSLSAEGGGRLGGLMHGDISAEDFIEFNKHLASITGGGMPLPEGLRALASDMKSGRFRFAIEEVRTEIEAGRSLSDALGRNRDVFSDLYVNLVKAGEKSGDLPAVLLMVAEQSRGLHRLRRQILEALAYPSIILGLVLVIFTGLSLFFWPHMRALFDDIARQSAGAFGSQALRTLPPLTQFILSATEPGIIVPVCGAMGLLLLLAWTVGRWTVAGRRLGVAALSRLPFMRELVRSYELSRTAGVLSMLLRGGAPLMEAIGVLAGSSVNQGLARSLGRMSALVSDGRPLSEAMTETGYFPETFTWMVSVGEKEGDLPRAFGDIAEIYEGRAAGATSVIEMVIMPAAVALAGLLVGAVAIGIMLPFIQLMEHLGG